MECRLSVPGDGGRYLARDTHRMVNTTISDHERTEINRLIDLFVAGENPDPVPERSDSEIDAIRASNALPTLEDWSAFAAITRDCELVWVDRDPPYSTRPIDDPRHRRFALFEASKRFPSLESLCPTRPDDARTCEHCDGTGRSSLGIEHETVRLGGRDRSVREIADGIVCYCGGVGWLLAGE